MNLDHQLEDCLKDARTKSVAIKAPTRQQARALAEADALEQKVRDAQVKKSLLSRLLGW